MTDTTTTIPTPQEILSRAADLIDERGWTQGDYVSEDGCVCALGAINVAAAEAAGVEIAPDDYLFLALYRAGGGYYQAARAAEELAGAQVAGQAPDGIVYYNDQVASLATQVVAVLRAAAGGGAQ